MDLAQRTLSTSESEEEPVAAPHPLGLSWLHMHWLLLVFAAGPQRLRSPARGIGGRSAVNLGEPFHLIRLVARVGPALGIM